MASSNIDDEKPNLRPTRYVDADGKSLTQRDRWVQPLGEALIYARWNDVSNNTKNASFDRPGLYGIEEPFVPRSLNKQQRWKLFDDARRDLADSSSSEDESPSSTRGKQDRNNQPMKGDARSPTRELSRNHVEIFSPGSERYTRMRRTPTTRRHVDAAITSERGDAQVQTANQGADRAASDITYVAMLSSRKKAYGFIRRQSGKKCKYLGVIGLGSIQATHRRLLVLAKKSSGHPERKKISARPEEAEDDSEERSTDTDGEREYLVSTIKFDFLFLSLLFLQQSTSEKLNALQLNDFLPLHTDQPSSVPSNELLLEEKFDPKSRRFHVDELIAHDRNNPFRRQMSREEKLYRRDMTAYLRQVGWSLIDPSHAHLLSLSLPLVSSSSPIRVGVSNRKRNLRISWCHSHFTRSPSIRANWTENISLGSTGKISFTLNVIQRRIWSV